MNKSTKKHFEFHSHLQYFCWRNAEEHRNFDNYSKNSIQIADSKSLWCIEIQFEFAIKASERSTQLAQVNTSTDQPNLNSPYIFHTCFWFNGRLSWLGSIHPRQDLAIELSLLPVRQCQKLYQHNSAVTTPSFICCCIYALYSTELFVLVVSSLASWNGGMEANLTKPRPKWIQKGFYYDING